MSNGLLSSYCVKINRTREFHTLKGAEWKKRYSNADWNHRQNKETSITQRGCVLEHGRRREICWDTRSFIWTTYLILALAAQQNFLWKYWRQNITSLISPLFDRKKIKKLAFVVFSQITRTWGQLCLWRQRCMSGGARVRSHTAARMSAIFKLRRTR